MSETGAQKGMEKARSIGVWGLVFEEVGKQEEGTEAGLGAAVPATTKAVTV